MNVLHYCHVSRDCQSEEAGSFYVMLQLEELYHISIDLMFSLAEPQGSQKVWKDLFTVGSASQPLLCPSTGPAFVCLLTDTIHLGTYGVS